MIPLRNGTLRIPVAALLATLAAPALAAAAVPLQPTSKWNVDFGDAHCIAMRNYGTDASLLMLAIKASPVGDVMQVSLVRPSMKQETNQYPGSMTIGDLPPTKVSVLGYRAKGSKNRIDAINLPLDQYQPLRTASVVRLRSAGEIDASFALSDMAPVARALDRCVAGLRSVWNIGGGDAVFASFPTSKKPLRQYFSSDDYPNVAAQGGATGIVGMTMLIDETGKVASCMVTATSGFASLDAQSCAIITVRAKFAPATGHDGKPIKSVYVQRIRWLLPSF